MNFEEWFDYYYPPFERPSEQYGKWIEEMAKEAWMRGKEEVINKIEEALKNV